MTGMIYHLKVTLLRVRPSVWRQVQVPEAITLPDLHTVLQVVMGWTDSHLHGFRVNEHFYTRADYELEDERVREERRARLNEIAAGVGSDFIYEYDFGDNWEHHVVVERVAASESHMTYPVCTGGARACPPEDCGGAGGYEEFLLALKSRRHEEHYRMLEWVGGAFDPAGFDLNGVNRALHSSPRLARYQ